MNTMKKLISIALIIAAVATIFASPSAFTYPTLAKVDTDRGNDISAHNYNYFRNCISGAGQSNGHPAENGITSCFAEGGNVHALFSGGNNDNNYDEAENVDSSVIYYDSNDQSIEDPYEVGWD